MRRVLRWLVLIVVVVVAGGALLLRLTAVQDFLMKRVVAIAMSRPPLHLFDDDALRLVVCGSASPLPHPTRARPCVAVVAGGKYYLVDTGPGSWNNMALWRIPAERVGAVFYTHLHSDHIGELGEVNMQTWVAGRPGPLAVYGPQGVDRLVNGFQEAYALDRGYRTAHHGADLLVPANGLMEAHPLEFPGTDQVIALRAGELTVTAFLVSHPPIEPALGYRFDYRGRSLVISGDTVKHAGLLRMARGVDLLVHEAQANHMVAVVGQTAAEIGRDRIAKIMGDIPSYHTTPVEAAQIANEAGVRMLVMYHLTPPPPNRLAERVFLRGVSEVRSDPTILADDGLVVTLPLGSTDVTTEHLR